MATTDYTLDDVSGDIADLRSMVTLLEEAHQQIDGGFVPNTPTDPNSHVLYSAAGTPSWVNDNGLQMGAMGAQVAWFPGNSVNGATQGNLAAWAIPANDAIAGAVYETEVWGNGTTGPTNQTLNFTVVLGGTNMAGVTIGTSFFATANLAFRWHMTVRVICHTTGTTGTWTSLISGEISAYNVNLIGQGGSQNTAGMVSCESTGTTTKDTTVANNVGLSASWGAGSSGETVTSQVAIAKRLC